MEKISIGESRREASRRKPLLSLLALSKRLSVCAEVCDARARDLTRVCASAASARLTGFLADNNGANTPLAAYSRCDYRREDSVFALLFLIFVFVSMHALAWSESVTEARMCLHPLPAWINGVTKNGKPKLVFSSPYEAFFSPKYYIPCGKCLGCQVDRRNRWISRMQLEHYCHDNVGTFITLTYRDPAPPRLVKKDVQLFLKRLRHLNRDFGVVLPSFKYFFCGEYGSKFGRPHYHGLLFGVDCFSSSFLTDIVEFKDGYPIYSSEVLAKVWKHGFITVDKITTSNIRYVSKYILKDHQKHGDEFTLKSIGLGADFFFDFPSERRSLPSKGCFYDYYGRGILHFPAKNGKMSCLPIPTKSFDRYVERIDPAFLESLKDERRSYYLTHKTTVDDISRRSQWLQVMTATKPNERKLDNES